jgi:cell division protease FtsH
MALGLTQALPIDERRTYSKTYCENQLAFMLGGRAAEKIVLGDLSTGAGNDIEKATKLARKMVCEWGMSEKLGPLTYGEKQEEIFLGREIGLLKLQNVVQWLLSRRISRNLRH